MLGRYRNVPTFGRDVIRKFSANTSELKKLAARDYEDLLQVSYGERIVCARSYKLQQCAMPVFDGLFPEPHNKPIQDLLFTMSHWHALAKLRMHTDETLAILDATTSLLGEQLRHFADVTCLTFDTYELPREVEARRRKASKKTNISQADAPVVSKKKRVYTMETYKHHALGDYANTIRALGTCDSYSTELVGNHVLSSFQPNGFI